MRRVGVREFRDRATQYLSGGEVLAIERHGRTVGYFIPVAPGSDEAVREGLRRLEAAVERLLAETDLDEDTLSEALDLSRPT